MSITTSTGYLVRPHRAREVERASKLSAKERAEELARLGKHLEAGLVTAHEYARTIAAMENRTQLRISVVT